MASSLASRISLSARFCKSLRKSVASMVVSCTTETSWDFKLSISVSHLASSVSQAVRSKSRSDSIL